MQDDTFFADSFPIHPSFVDIVTFINGIHFVTMHYHFVLFYIHFMPLIKPFYTPVHEPFRSVFLNGGIVLFAVQDFLLNCKVQNGKEAT